MLSGKKVDLFLFPSQLQICRGNPNHLHRLTLLYQSCPQSPSTIQADYLPSRDPVFALCLTAVGDINMQYCYHAYTQKRISSVCFDKEYFTPKVVWGGKRRNH